MNPNNETEETPQPADTQTSPNPDISTSDNPTGQTDPLIVAPEPMQPDTNGQTPSVTPQPNAINQPPLPQQTPDFNANPTAATQLSAQPSAAPSAGLIVLQWLTYAFWGWTVLSLSVLTATVLANFIGDADTGGFTPYGIAATLVLLPISYICDTFYAKSEPEKKSGAEIIVMVIHAVIFALFGIGALIYAVIALVQMFTNSDNTAAASVGLFSSLIITAFYAITFLRTLNPINALWIRKWYKLVMLVSVGVIVLLGIVGPVANERKTRDDRLIESGLTPLSSSVNNYSIKNNRLPSSLSQLSLSGDSKRVVERNLVTYKPGSAESNKQSTSSSTFSTSESIYKYELCVNYKEESKNYGSSSTSDNLADNDGYSSYLSTYDHPSGEVCYKLKTSDY